MPVVSVAHAIHCGCVGNACRAVYHRYMRRRAILIIIYEEIGILHLLLYENVMVVGTYNVVPSYLYNKIHYKHIH